MSAGEVIAIVIAVASAGMSGLALRYSYQSAQAALRAADAAERQAVAAEATVPPPPPAVEWVIAPGLGEGHYVLRNRGVGTAENLVVEVPGYDADHITISPSPDRVLPGGSVRVHVSMFAETPDVSDLYVSWDGQPDPVILPVPQR